MQRFNIEMVQVLIALGGLVIFCASFECGLCFIGIVLDGVRLDCVCIHYVTYMLVLVIAVGPLQYYTSI
jgi:hypothetical protein